MFVAHVSALLRGGCLQIKHHKVEFLSATEWHKAGEMHDDRCSMLGSLTLHLSVSLNVLPTGRCLNRGHFARQGVVVLLLSLLAKASVQPLSVIENLHSLSVLLL